MNQHKPGQKTLISVHGYAGDRHQIDQLLPYYEYHQCPIVVMSPQDSQIHGVGPHICRAAGKRAYIGKDSLDRQWAQMKILLEYPFDFYLMHDSDSFVATPDIPQYVYDRSDTFFSNEVDDFRRPGESWQGMPPWPKDYHKGHPLIAMQPPYFMSRRTLEKLVAASDGIVACQTTPFIDWGMVQVCVAAKVKHARFNLCASCETVTPLGRAVMRQCVGERQAQFLHAIKSGDVAKELRDLYVSTYGS